MQTILKENVFFVKVVLIVHSQITLRMGDKKVNVFLQTGFYNCAEVSSPLHKHLYPEIHWILRGRAEYTIGNKRVTLEEGTVVVFPAQMYHECSVYEEGTQRMAFQADIEVSEYISHALPSRQLIPLFYDEKVVRRNELRYDVLALLTMLCAIFDKGGKTRVQPIQDAAFIIEEFFLKRYNSRVTVADLAEQLQLSEKQTQRLVQKHTGRTFSKELCHRRMQIAHKLLQSEQYSLTEVAEYVGFHSYSGFWKAYRSYTKKD